MKNLTVSLQNSKRLVESGINLKTHFAWRVPTSKALIMKTIWNAQLNEELLIKAYVECCQSWYIKLFRIFKKLK